MKKLLKLFAIALMTSVFALGFVSCSNDSDDDDDPLATFVGTESYDGTFDDEDIEDYGIDSKYLNKKYTEELKYTIKFYDTTYEVVGNFKITCEGSTLLNETATFEKGKYTITEGDFTNGTVVLLKTHDYFESSGLTELSESDQEETEISIVDSKFKYDYFEFTKQ